MQKCEEYFSESLSRENIVGGTHLSFLVLYSDIIYDISVLELDYTKMITLYNEYLFPTEKYRDEYVISFNSGEYVMQTPMFKKYLKRRRTELAEYMTKFYGIIIAEHEIAEVIDYMLKSKANDHGVPLDYTLGGVFNSACKRILIEHNGGLDWYESITSRKDSSFEIRLNHVPDVDVLIEKYYNELMRYKKAEVGDEFSKVYLMRECKSESPLIDLISIMFMYNVDVFSKMLTNLLEEYYKTFSWEKLVYKSLSERYDNIILSLENNIKTLTNKLENDEMKIRVLNEQLRKEKGAEIIPLEKMIADYTKKLEDKDKEIEKLKL